VQEYERLLEKNSKVASAHMIFGMIAEQGNEIQETQTHYRTTLEIETKFSPAANNLAWLMAEHGGNLDEALSLAESARTHQEDNPHIADTLAWIYYKKWMLASGIATERGSGKAFRESGGTVSFRYGTI